MTAFFLLVSSVAASMLVIPLAWRLAPHIGMVDQPDARKVHKSPVPRVGGWGIVAGMLLPLLLLRPLDALTQSFVAGTLVLFVFGAWDDARQISHWPKFAGQLLAVGLVVFWGGLYVTRLPFLDGDVLGPWSGRAFTLVTMVGTINAINHSDGLDGLAAGETLLSLIAVAFLGYLAGAPPVTHLALLVIGGIIGFLRYNTHPARVFMGDSGSQVLGFSLAFLVIHLLQDANRAASAALPLLLLGLPIADILVVLYKRISGGMNWFKATRNHVHHRLLDLGFTHYQSVVVIYSFQACLVTAAMLLRYAPDAAVAAFYAVAIGGLFAFLGVAERSSWRLADSALRLPAVVSGWLVRLLRSSRMQALFVWSIAATVSFLLLFAVFRSGQVPRDFGVLAGIAVVLSVLAVVARRAWEGPALRVVAYVTVPFATYLLTNYPATPDAGMLQGFGAVVIVLAIMLAIFVRFVSEQRFGATPTDYLIAFALLAMLAFGGLGRGDAALEAPLRFVIFSIVLFYGCEVIIGHLQRWRTVLGSASLATLLVVAVRGLATGF
ncbi:MAG TPA: MraY family glycosyltransferase [Steroidobacteraceae bacterium]|nr:MraY family glycosyltransferase [Steroidobacteraceae bacterium]